MICENKSDKRNKRTPGRFIYEKSFYLNLIRNFFIYYNLLSINNLN